MKIGERVRSLFRQLDLGRQIAFRALAAFLVTFGLVRGITYSIHYHLLPLRNLVTSSGLHIHHLFWGILLLMVVGFVALATRDPRWHLRLALGYGVALAFTLDEFALWLRLADVYWSPEGRQSLEAVAVTAALLALYAVSQPFWAALGRDLARPRGRREGPDEIRSSNERP